LLDDLERRIGPMPLSLRAWYETVGTVNLIGSHEDWLEIETVDPLVVCPLADMLRCIDDEYEDWREELKDLGDEAEPFTFDFAPDDLHKANISGGPPYGVEYPSTLADAPVHFERHHTTFVDYLRVALQWGGFPGFDRVKPSTRLSEHISYLTADLVSF
jgi:hypothetical protein